MLTQCLNGLHKLLNRSLGFDKLSWWINAIPHWIVLSETCAARNLLIWSLLSGARECDIRCSHFRNIQSSQESSSQMPTVHSALFFYPHNYASWVPGSTMHQLSCQGITVALAFSDANFRQWHARNIISKGGVKFWKVKDNVLHIDDRNDCGRG